MAYETELWPFVEAKYYTRVSEKRKVRVLVMHTMEAPEGPSTAENIARYFATMPDDRKASAHVCVDSNSVVQCVKDNNVAYAAPGCNNDGIQVELAGFAGQGKKGWFDLYSLALLAIAADVAAQYCLKYSIPAVHLTDSELRLNKTGIVGHDQVSRVYKKSDHSDPGPTFPWTRFIMTTTALITERR